MMNTWTVKPTMKEIFKIIGKFLLISLILGIPGCAIGYSIASIVPDPDDTKWMQLPAPPEPAVKIVELGGSGQGVTIETASGTQYECCAKWGSPWSRLEYNRTRYGYYCDQFRENIKKLRDQLPAEPVDCAYRMQYEWATEQYYVALLPDGSLWRWYYFYSIGNLFQGMAIGSGIGVIIGLGWLVYQLTRGKKNTTTSTTHQ